MRIDHMGVATENADELAERYGALFGAPVAHEEEFDGLKVVFLDFEGSYFELLEPTEEGTVSRYLDRRGPGIHHVALRTEDIESALKTAREHGVELIDEEPRPGAWGHDVAFLHPKSTGGVLVEYVEH
ncbi:methylmalonyl-CoA epimerase [Haladaptatus salinisoli]|uniref:methylmalonyl-CoA epimerase n=1 Tax=Haladaptatus salinisoli TaxID=2884876 RepID=UPI001D0BB0C2|nr:methylmalonyl-CoA epimerase [Haladaptatus salinisoli]